MKRFIIAGLVAGLVAAFCNQWIRYERDSTAHKHVLDQKLAEVQRAHPDWQYEEIASEVARDVTSGRRWIFVIPSIVWVVVLLLKPRWWYLVVALVLVIAGSFWIATSVPTLANKPPPTPSNSEVTQQSQPIPTNSMVAQQPPAISKTSIPTLPSRAQLLDQIAKLKDGPAVTNPVVKDMENAYGFWIGQNYSIEQITKRFPDLEKRFKTAQFGFSQKYEAGLTNIESILKTRFSKEIAAARSVLLKKLSEADFSRLNQRNALAFLQELSNRANDPLASPTYETILEFTPAYISAPEQEFSDGFRKKYSTLNDPGAEGIHPEFQYPASWKAEPGNRPEIIQQMTSENGRGLQNMNVTIVDPGPEFGTIARQLDSEFRSEIYGSIDNIKKFVPPGATFLEGKSAMLDQQPAALIYYDLTMKRVDLVITVRGMLLESFYHGKFVALTFSVGTNPGEGQMRPAVFEKFRPLFLLIANSVVLK